MVHEFISFFWCPWVTLNVETMLLQFCILYLLFIIYNSKNVYYTLLYVFILFFFFGIYLAFWQIDIFTGFLWLLEITILFVYLLVLFYLNFKGYTNSLQDKEYFFNKYFVILFYFYINFFFISACENSSYEEINFFLLWENYYEPLVNFTMNDFSLFLLSYYTFNSLEFVLIGLILLLGSIVCVNLYRSNKDQSSSNINAFLTSFHFFKDTWNYNFLRKQNLTNQNLTIPSTRIFSKKV